MATISNVFKPTTALNSFVSGTQPKGLIPAPKTTINTSTPAVIPSQLAPKTNGYVSPGSQLPSNNAGGYVSPGSTPNNFESISGAKSYVPPPTTFNALSPQPQTYNTQTYGTTNTNNIQSTGSTNNTSYSAPVAQNTAVYTPQSTQAPVAPIKGLFSDVASSLAGSGAANTALGQNAQNIASDAAAQIADTGRQGARFAAGQRTTGTSPVAEGNAAVTAQTTAAEQQAIAAGANVALQGNQQALSAQGQTQSALNAAGNLTQPNPAAYGQAVFDPVAGTYSGGGSNLDPQTQATSLAQKVMSGQMTYDQAMSSLSYAGNVGSNFLNNAITQAGGNPLQLQASGSATQGIVGTQATQIAGYQSALQQGQNLQSQLTDLIHTFGLNPNDVNAVNTGIQTIAKNTSDPRYQILSNYVNDIANTYSQILTPPGGSATDTTRGIATSMLNATASGQSLISVMQSLDQAAKAKIAGVSTTGASTGSSSGSTTGTVQTSAGAVNTNW